MLITSEDNSNLSKTKQKGFSYSNIIDNLKKTMNRDARQDQRFSNIIEQNRMYSNAVVGGAIRKDVINSSMKIMRN